MVVFAGAVTLNGPNTPIGPTKDLIGERRGSSRTTFPPTFLGGFPAQSWHSTTSTGSGKGDSRVELEESYPGMGLTSLEVEREPSYEGLKFDSIFDQRARTSAGR